MRRPIRLALVLLFLSPMMMTACAFDLAHVKFDPVTITECADDCRELQVQQEVALTNMPCGYNRVIKKETILRQTGTMQEGQIFKPVNRSFTVECSNVFEAYFVIAKDLLQGFYLPVQDGYVALKQPVQMSLY